MPLIPIALKSPPIVVGMRQTRSAMRTGIENVAFANIDRTPGAAGKTGVERPGWVLEGRAARKGQLDLVFVNFARADHPGMLPHRDARGIGRLSPLHFLDNVRIGLLDEPADGGERGSAPVAEVGDPLIDLLTGTHLPTLPFFRSSAFFSTS